VTFPHWLHEEWTKLLLVLFLSFLIGLQREERKAVEGRYAFGGVRTFPLIGMIGYLMAFVSDGELLPVALGLIAVSGFLMLSYWHKLKTTEPAGVTTEMTGLATYLVGVMVYKEHFWIATAVSVASLLLLELKVALEGLARRIGSDDLLTFAKFLLLTAVVLPLLPDQPFTRFRINPFETWLVVVAVSAVSYGSYVLQRATREKGGLILAAVLGGMYSSTVTTVALARRSLGEENPYLFSGSILVASGVMYLRLIVLLGIFNRALMLSLAPAFAVLAVVAIAIGWYWSSRSEKNAADVEHHHQPKNPLELGTALVFALVFLAMLVGTHLALTYFGDRGLYLFAGLMGVTDVDPFVMGITQAVPAVTPLAPGAAAVLIAAASNNLVKGIYAYVLAPRETGAASLVLLFGLAALGLLPLIWQ
jgi:uncharacterized membrane protein (DUF4010 family)